MSALSLDVNLRAISEQIQAGSGKVRYIACLKKESMLRTVCAAVQQSRQQPPVRLPGWQSADSEAATCSPVFLRTLCIGPESS